MTENSSNTDYRGQLGEADQSDNLNDIDIEKLLNVVKGSIIYVIIIFAITCSSAYLFLRYTKPVFESSSQLKLNIQNEAMILGVQNPLENSSINTLSGEIELLKSNLFFDRVVDAINYDVSYFYYGNVLTEERYNNSPFVVSHTMNNQSYCDRPFQLEIVSSEEFVLSLDLGGELKSSTHKFGQIVVTPEYNLLIEKTDDFSDDNGIGKYYFTINSKAALISYFQNNVAVLPLNFSAKTIQISLKDFNRYKARDFVTAIDTLYLKYTKEEKNQAIEQKISFLNEQLEITERKIDDYEDYFENFTIDNKTTDIQNDLGQAIILLKTLDSQRFDLQNKLSSIELLGEQIERNEPISMAQAGSRGVPDYIGAGLSEYNKIQAERDAILGSYNENTFAVSRITQKLAVLRSATLQLVVDYKENLSRALREIDARKAKLERNFVELPSMGTEFNKTRRFYNLQEEFYFSLIKSKAELEIAKAGTVEDFDILSPASLASSPVHPSKLIVYGIGAVSGLLLSLLLVGVRYLMHNKITGQRELERLVNVPILGSVPFYKKEKMPTTRMVVHENPKSVISESLRSIRTNMDFIQGSGGKKTIAITSTISGEGKTFIVVNLGAIIAKTGQKVLVVDLDMRKPKIHLAFGKEKEEKGMSTILIGRDKYEDCVNETEVEGLFYLTAGPTPPNPSELLLGTNFDLFVNWASENYDMVILDTPPVGLVTDGVIVMRKTDLSLYVVRADYSRKVFLKTLFKLVKMNRFNNISIVLNSVKTRAGSNYGHSYGYGYGYGYGYYDDDEGKSKRR